MSSKRPTILMGVLLACLAGYVATPMVQERLFPGPRPNPAAEPAPLPGTNTISGLSVARTADGRWMATVDYFYTGAPKHLGLRLAHTLAAPGYGNASELVFHYRGAQRGAQRAVVEITNPNVHEALVTERVTAYLATPTAERTALVSSDQVIRWPDPVVVQVEQALAAGTPQVIVDKAVQMIDTNETTQMPKARALLQALVEKSPGVDAAYVELARVAMKTNWNPTGLRDAENLIGSALQIRPDSINAKILLGYVYAYQGRYKQAEALFVEAAAARPANLWLWTNWGELLVMQGKADAAIAKYREGLAHPPTRDTYDRARQFAYVKLLELLKARDDLNGSEALLKQRAQEYAVAECFLVDYARFLALHRGDAAASLQVLADAPTSACPPWWARQTKALAHYVKWAGSKEPERTEALHQARALMPGGPFVLYWLATSEKGAAVAQQLVAAGENISLQDEKQLDALAHALRNGESRVAHRLVRMGAKPDALVGPEQMPVALIPVLTRDFDSIRVLQRGGVDYTRLRYRGSTAVDHARGQDDQKLLQLLDPKAGSL
ncbi:MAG TPA: hypothetical protein VHL79_20645 [Ramlibacter sp.]|jgi:tetratricopeptide (TPR) repeat protein|nr:hypothetical protein [Ramlibacter sp.]